MGGGKELTGAQLPVLVTACTLKFENEHTFHFSCSSCSDIPCKLKSKEILKMQ